MIQSVDGDLHLTRAQVVLGPEQHKPEELITDVLVPQSEEPICLGCSANGGEGAPLAISDGIAWWTGLLILLCIGYVQSAGKKIAVFISCKQV